MRQTCYNLISPNENINRPLPTTHTFSQTMPYNSYNANQNNRNRETQRYNTNQYNTNQYNRNQDTQRYYRNQYERNQERNRRSYNTNNYFGSLSSSDDDNSWNRGGITPVVGGGGSFATVIQQCNEVVQMCNEIQASLAELRKSLKEREHLSSATTQREPNMPFIHGRHTCDSCSKKPIVGTRYHATNISNFDVCQSCFDLKSYPPDFQFVVLEEGKHAHMAL